MRLEDAVKVNQFRNESQKAIINLYYTNGLVSGQFKNILKPHGITPQQYNILRILKGQQPNPVRIGMVKERLIDRNADVTRLVERLIKKGLLNRKVCEEDRRQQHLEITSNGLSVLSTIEKDVIDFENATQRLSQEELQQFNALMDKLRSAYTDQ